MRSVTTILVYLACPAIAVGQDIDPLATNVDGEVPRTVIPGAQLGDAPSDAIVLFDGRSLDEWESTEGGDADWIVENGVVTVVAGLPNIRSRRSFGDVQLHLEWRSPLQSEHLENLKTDHAKYIEENAARFGLSQFMANSGVFLQEKYEIQVLETYGAYTYINGQTGAVYKQHVPLVSATNSPGEWQIYDIVFRAPRFGESGSVAVPARLTLFVNGVLVHNDVELWGPTEFVGLPRYEAHGPAPILLQSHLGVSQISFRNIWVREL